MAKKLPVLLLLAALTQAGWTQSLTRGAVAARLPSGKPDFNGIWQAVGSAHYDIERHIARPALQTRKGPYGPLPDIPVMKLGAVAAVPGGMGIVDGGVIPYKPEAAKKRDENRANPPILSNTFDAVIRVKMLIDEILWL